MFENILMIVLLLTWLGLDLITMKRQMKFTDDLLNDNFKLLKENICQVNKETKLIDIITNGEENKENYFETLEKIKEVLLKNNNT